MYKRRLRQCVVLAASAAVFFVTLSGMAMAQSANSTNFRIDETQFGAGAGNSCSGSYCSQASLGDAVVGEAESESYTVQFGAITSNDPLLEVIAEGGSQSLGILDVDRTATSTNIIKIRSYMVSGYVLQITGGTPNQGTHSLAGLTQQSTSHAGAEQFGINLVANTAPEVGADPVQVPSSEVSFGQVASDYATPNLFKYISGQTVAFSNQSSGQTNYTVSMIVNVSNATPGGRYNSEFSAVVVPTY